jgi:hypothetical protein
MLSKGKQFEVSCCGYIPTKKFTPISGRKIFDEVIGPSIRYALSQGLDHKKLEKDRAHFWRVFCQVRQCLPRRFRRFLRVVITIGTDVDYHQGCDILFTLGRKIVPIDLTLILSKDLHLMLYPKNNSLIFHYNMLDDRSIAVFAKKVAEMLMDTDLGRTVPEDVYNQYRNFLYKPTS